MRAAGRAARKTLRLIRSILEAIVADCLYAYCVEWEGAMVRAVCPIL